MSSEPDPQPIVFVWWGENATDQDKDVWEQFKTGFTTAFSNITFLEASSRDEFQQIASQLETEGWIYNGRGIKIWMRMHSWLMK